MGSIRRRLIAFFSLMPSTTFANVCAVEVPDWDGTPATALSGAIGLFSTAPSLILIFATLLVLRLKSVWGGLATVVGWTVWISVINSPTVFPSRDAAIAEGCIGPNTLFIALAIAICVGIVLYTSPRVSVAKNGEE